MFIKIYCVFPRLPFGIVTYAFTLFLGNLCRNSCILLVLRSCGLILLENIIIILYVGTNRIVIYNLDPAGSLELLVNFYLKCSLQKNQSLIKSAFCKVSQCFAYSVDSFCGHSLLSKFLLLS